MLGLKKKLLLGIGWIILLISLTSPLFAQVQFNKNQLFVDGKAQPQLYGAELQYFRIRGGYGPNVPREKVIELWNKALDRMVEAKMNFISFYIPWDFHEYADGKYDFTGTVDQDKDGNADYPSRDIHTFFRLIQEHGIKQIMVRPGPYINAEWGFLGFGAIPRWFHEKYPDSHMKNSKGQRAKLYDYFYEPLLVHSKRWFTTLYNQVLKNKIGLNKPIKFMQIDNETNYMWQSLYNVDYGERAIARYQTFLKNKYKSLPALNYAQKTSVRNWTEITAPTELSKNPGKDRDWYEFHDVEIADYLEVLRRMWESLGVAEPQVLFTLAESYNATYAGLIPNYETRNRPNRTGMMTVNLYPKTYGEHLINSPFKADLDVKSAETASDYYLNSQQEWVMGPEIQGGWWPGTPVKEESRQQTYLTTIGHGLKALMIYYFTEGDNWESHWGYDQAQLQFRQLKNHPDYKQFADAKPSEMPESFWKQLQNNLDTHVILGLDAKYLCMWANPVDTEKLYFQAPLDRNLEPRSTYFDVIKKVGTELVSKYGSYLGKAVAVTDSVAFLKDSSLHAPSDYENKGLSSVSTSTDNSGALLGLWMAAGINPKVIHRDLPMQTNWRTQKMVIFQDNGVNAPALFNLQQEILQYVKNGGVWVNFLYDRFGPSLNLTTQEMHQNGTPPVHFMGNNEIDFEIYVPFMSTSILHDPSTCEEILWTANTNEVLAYRCKIGNGVYYHIGAPFYWPLNTDWYETFPHAAMMTQFIRDIVRTEGMRPQIEVSGGSDHIVAFARKQPDSNNSIWLTVKNGSRETRDGHMIVRSLIASQQAGQMNTQMSQMVGQTKTQMSQMVGQNKQKMVQSQGKIWLVKDLFNQTEEQISDEDIRSKGFTFNLPAYGSTVFFIQ